MLSCLALVLYSGTPALLGLGLAWSLAVGLLHFGMSHSGKISIYRTFFFALLAVFFLADLHLNGATGKDIRPVCHLSLAGDMAQLGYGQFLALANGNAFKYGVYGLVLLWLLVIFVNGGGFCGWVCFFGGVDDAFSQALKKPLIKLPALPRFREFQLAALLFFAFMSLLRLEPVFCLWVCPFKKTVGEVLDPQSPAFAYQVAAFVFIAAVFVVGLPLLTKKRTFCSILCPFGALPPLMHKITPYRVTIDPQACTQCLKCVDTCPSFAIQSREGRVEVNRYCTHCMRCAGNCPKGAIRPTLFHKKGSSLLPLVSMAFGGALSLFYAPQGILALVEWARRLFP